MSDINTQKFTNVGNDNLIVIPDTTEASNGDVLTYITTSGIIWKAPEGGGGSTELTAGTDLQIVNGVISVKTQASTANTNYAFAEGIKTSANGMYSHSEGSATLAYDTYSHAEGNSTTANGQASHAEGAATLAKKSRSHAEGNKTSALGFDAHAEGYSAIASGDQSHAEGYLTLARDSYTHAEGHQTSAILTNSHSEGVGTLASGWASHAEGNLTSALGYYSHSEGGNTLARGYYSHAEGWGTIANGQNMHVQGRWNKITSNVAFVIGNGTSDSDRSDAFVIKNDGTVSGTGNIYASGGQVVTDVMLTSATNSTTSFVTNGVADLTPLYTYIKSLEDRIAALEAAQGGDGFTVNGIQPTVNGNTITVGE